MEAGVQPEAAGVRAGSGVAQDTTTGPPFFRRKRNFARVAGLLGLALLTGLLHARALAAVAVVIVILLAGFVFPWLAVRGVRACWHYPLRRGQVGKPLPVRVTLRSRLPWPAVGLLLRGGWTSAGSPADPATVAVPRVPARGRRDVTGTAIPEHRGVYPLFPATLATGFPFGLWRTRTVESDGQVLVWPEIIPLPAPAADAGRPMHGQTERARRSGQHGEFYGTRPHRPGESLRRVHWKQSARHDRLIVWEARAVAKASVVLLLETAAEVHAAAGPGRSDSLEKTLSVGASLASGLVEGGLHITLGFEPGRLFSIGNRPQLEVALDAMARFDPSQGASRDVLLAQLNGRAVRSEVPWLVTTLSGWNRSGGPLEMTNDQSPMTKPEESLVLATGRGSLVIGHWSFATLIPLADPDHRRFHAVWKEVLVGLETLV
jgi:uncharacterized protein (DUF58 family)